MVDIPQTMEERDYCKDFYFTLANTLIVIDEGRWLGIRFGKRIYMLQMNNSEISDPYDCYKYILGHPYFILDYAGKEKKYSDEALEYWKKLYWSKRPPKYD